MEEFPASAIATAPLAWPAEKTAERAPARETEDLLVRRAQAGDQMAFCELVERYQSRVHAVIFRVLGVNNDAEDVAQQVFANAFLSIASYKAEASFMSWLYRIAVNESYEYLRRKKARPLCYSSDLGEAQEQVIQTRVTVPSAEPDVTRRDLAVKLLSHVTPNERTLLILREVEGYSIQELADMLGANANTVKLRLFRARRKLLRASKRYGEA